MGWSPMNFTELTALACDIDILTLVMVNLERSHLKGHALTQNKKFNSKRFNINLSDMLIKLSLRQFHGLEVIGKLSTKKS